MVQKPQGPADFTCPFHRVAMSKVCHKCPLWVHLRGTNRNTGQEEDDWRCTFSFLPDLLVENSMQQRHTCASTDKVANEIDKFRTHMAQQNHTFQKLLIGGPRDE